MLTPDQVTALAPDASSLKAGNALATDRKWQSLGKDEEVIWGLAKGSGKNPYQTRVSLQDLAYKCTCPSRKFPCKHALGLMLLYANSPEAFTENERPEWVSEWLSSRKEREEKATKRAASTTSKPKDEKAAAKRAAKKSARIDDGIQHLEQVLFDIIRNGLAQETLTENSYWENLARRLIDSQAPGLAGYVRRLGEIPLSGLNWETQLLHELGSLHLLIEAYSKLSKLAPDLRSEIQQLIGSTPSKEELLKEKGFEDQWFVAARTTSEQDRLTTSATWLYGSQSKKWALKLEFSAQPSRPVEHWPLGSTVATELVFYPGLAPDRVLPRNAAASAQANNPRPTPNGDFQQLLANYSAQLALNPWRTRMPCYLSAQPVSHDRQQYLIDRNGDGLRWKASTKEVAMMHSLSGGHCVDLCALWNGQHLTILSLADGHTWLSLDSLVI